MGERKGCPLFQVTIQNDDRTFVTNQVKLPRLNTAYILHEVQEEYSRGTHSMMDVFKNDPWQHKDKHRGRFNLVVSEHADGINLAMATFY